MCICGLNRHSRKITLSISICKCFFSIMFYPNSKYLHIGLTYFRQCDPSFCSSNTYLQSTLNRIASGTGLNPISSSTKQMLTGWANFHEPSSTSVEGRELLQCSTTGMKNMFLLNLCSDNRINSLLQYVGGAFPKEVEKCDFPPFSIDLIYSWRSWCLAVEELGLIPQSFFT